MGLESLPQWFAFRETGLGEDAWIDESATRLGYEISFTRHFYKPPEMRPLDEIKADLEALQDEAEGLLDEIVAGGTP